MFPCPFRGINEQNEVLSPHFWVPNPFLGVNGGKLGSVVHFGVKLREKGPISGIKLRGKEVPKLKFGGKNGEKGVPEIILG